ncbi:MAG: hypothetical protein HFE52_01405, partial [Clostridia bacterium]|nr:hypothetical protein [Clostridia bacterium]
MQRVAKFEKVSFEQFKKDWLDTFYNTENIEEIYKGIKMPKRATSGSAGYDFYSTLAFELKPGESIKIPTGIRAKINDGWVLKLYPRSGLGFKFRVQMNNTVGIIDSDYSKRKCSRCSVHPKTVSAMRLNISISYSVSFRY